MGWKRLNYGVGVGGWWETTSFNRSAPKEGTTSRPHRATARIETEPGQTEGQGQHRSSVKLTHEGSPAGGAGSLGGGGSFTNWTTSKRIPIPRWASCLSVGRPAQEMKKGVQASRCQTLRLWVSARHRGRAKARCRPQGRQHSASASITAELSRRGSAQRWR